MKNLPFAYTHFFNIRFRVECFLVSSEIYTIKEMETQMPYILFVLLLCLCE